MIVKPIITRGTLNNSATFTAASTAMPQIPAVDYT
jgi:hypothetical protein